MRSTSFVLSVLFWMVGLALCAAPQVTLRERASAFPLITEKDATEVDAPYAWRLPVVPLSLDNREIRNFAKFPLLPSLSGGILTVRVLVVGDTVAVHRDLMDDFAKRCRATLGLGVRTAPKLFGIKGMHVYGVQKDGSRQAVDKQVTLHLPGFEKAEKPLLYKGQEGRLVLCEYYESHRGDLFLDVANAHPEIFGELCPVVDFHFPVELRRAYAWLLLEIELEDGTKLSTSLQHYDEQTSILDHPDRS